VLGDALNLNILTGIYSPDMQALLLWSLLLLLLLVLLLLTAVALVVVFGSDRLRQDPLVGMAARAEQCWKVCRCILLVIDKIALHVNPHLFLDARSLAAFVASSRATSRHPSLACKVAGRRVLLSRCANPVKCVIAFYNIGWTTSRFNRLQQHERTLTADLRTALAHMMADVVLLCECGEIEEGLPREEWLAMLGRICGPGFAVEHQSHYTSIVRQETMEVTQQPTLWGPLTFVRGHEYRKCQYLQVRVKDSAAKPIDIVNCHSPGSRRRPLTVTIREHILKWLVDNTSNNAIIGGDLNINLITLDMVLKHTPDIKYLMEPNWKHGDIIVTRSLNADSMACEINSTSDEHKMCVAMVKQEVIA